MHSIRRPPNLRRLSRVLSISTALLLLSGCTHVQIVDHEFCGDLGSQGASCFHTLTEESRDIPKAQWDDMRFGQICTNDPPDQAGATFADWKGVIEKLCSLSGDCDYQTKVKIESFFDRTDTFKSKYEAMRGVK